MLCSHGTGIVCHLCDNELTRIRTKVEELKNRIDKAVVTAHQYAQIDGDHHKMWVIDQMVRDLLDEDYPEFIRKYCEGEDGPDTYSWEEGIPP